MVRGWCALDPALERCQAHPAATPTPPFPPARRAADNKLSGCADAYARVIALAPDADGFDWGDDDSGDDHSGGGGAAGESWFDLRAGSYGGGSPAPLEQAHDWASDESDEEFGLLANSCVEMP